MLCCSQKGRNGHIFCIEPSPSFLSLADFCIVGTFCAVSSSGVNHLVSEVELLLLRFTVTVFWPLYFHALGGFGCKTDAVGQDSKPFSSSFSWSGAIGNSFSVLGKILGFTCSGKICKLSSCPALVYCYWRMDILKIMNITLKTTKLFGGVGRGKFYICFSNFSAFTYMWGDFTVSSPLARRLQMCFLFKNESSKSQPPVCKSWGLRKQGRAHGKAAGVDKCTIGIASSLRWEIWCMERKARRAFNLTHWESQLSSLPQLKQKAHPRIKQDLTSCLDVCHGPRTAGGIWLLHPCGN